MSIETYINSDEFRFFLDEPLRQNACQAVEAFFNDFTPVNNVQLHSVPTVIQAGGLKALKDLMENQKKKNTKEINQKFWEFLYNLFFGNPGPEFSLRSFIEAQPRVQGLLEDETNVSDKKEQKQIRKANKAKVEEIMAQVLPVYFEHFNCHYFYMKLET